MIQKNPAVIIVALCIGLAVGFFADRTLQSGTISGQTAQIQKLQSQIDVAKKYFPSSPSSVTVISGTVTNISGDIVTFETNLFNPLEDSSKVRMVTITNNTAIYIKEPRDQVGIQQQILKLEKKGIAPTVQPGYPAGTFPDFFYVQSKGSRTDLKTGQSVIVTAGEDIRKKTSFEAQKIEIILVSASSEVTP